MAIKQLIEAPLVVVTNREPYIDERVAGGIRTIQTAGGVVSALDPLLQEIGGNWVAWGSGNADIEMSSGGQRQVPPERPRYTLNRITLSPEEVQGYYAKYSNQGLWPLSHMLIERAQFSRRAWQTYRSVNQKFAKRVSAVSPPGAWVFSHDYQLALFPAFVRKTRPDVTIAHFWHIPWPPLPIFRLCPQHQEILRGLLGADVLGFQSEQDVEYFLNAVERTLKTTVNRETGRIDWQGRSVHVKSFPISVDVNAIEAMVESPRIRRWVRGIRRHVDRRDQILGISVDRADYTKGLLPRLDAMKEFYTLYPQYREHVTYLQIVVPSRTEVAEYRRFYEQVEKKTQEVNQRFATNGWKPIITLPHSLDRPRLMGLFRAADFAVVSSLVDGMNLVAKEFVAAQVDKRGVLLLSETTGAANELEHESFPINPLDPEGFANTLHEALSISADERADRISAMRKHLEEHTIYDWMADIFLTLKMAAQSYV
ncbi:MAG: trehalose-6-phosphate synthase [Sulfobacillus thermosulfidooxidans]|uniref:alpha,alpha-trehalose-phosphate synthase (UDP-forming) n=1 Tax=Sulfobacillus sp. hq2 TaxID=2039167 RepID=UPI000CD2E654|nr:trehalose-6-phosphate synthase [Sulfobacillus sp. hq2]POB09144.1 alpha,alpha-trehalose-phosphate synthase [Sulfobacillus sp. hq2]PSR37000.1 MAG: trehalose-6-phosphate synthase [Sulfobacillus thermosulfidooxidans]